MLMMRAFFAVAPSMPLRILKVALYALYPDPEKARTAGSLTLGATPTSLLFAAITPAIAVPLSRSHSRRAA
jgi:hypothetical protein